MSVTFPRSESSCGTRTPTLEAGALSLVLRTTAQIVAEFSDVLWKSSVRTISCPSLVPGRSLVVLPQRHLFRS